MANLSFRGLDELGRKLDRMGQKADAVKEAMLNEGADVCVRVWKQTAEAKGHRDTGDMINSIRAKKSGKDGRVIYPMGKDRKGVRNADKAFILNYGTSGGRIKADGWCDQADEQCEMEAVPVMRAVFNRMMEE